MSNINNLYGIENVQAKQLVDLNKTYFCGENTSIDAISQVTSSINQSMVDLSGNVNGVLTQQGEVLDVVNANRSELEERKKQLELVKTTQIRELELTESQRKRHLSYVRQILVVVIVVAILWLIRFLASIFTIVPDSFWTMVYAIIIFFGAITLYYMYQETETHDRLQYDNLKLSGPDNKPTKMPDASGNLLAPYFGCNGQDCCGLDTVWVPEKGKCVKVASTCSTNAPTNAPTKPPRKHHKETPPSSPRGYFKILSPPIF